MTEINLKDDFLLSFIRREEMYWPLQPENLEKMKVVPVGEPSDQIPDSL